MGLLDRFKSRHAPTDLESRIVSFREVLQANNTALGCIARMQEVLAGERRLVPGEERRLVTGAMVETYRMVEGLSRMTGDRLPEIRRRFDEIRTRLTRTVQMTPVLTRTGLVVPLEEVGLSIGEVVGQKSSYLGEALRILEGRVPEGFATTVEAYRAFVGAGGLGEGIAEILRGIDVAEVSSCFHASSQIMQMIENAPVPLEIADAITWAARRLPGYLGLTFAVRSSALQEGGTDVSFAGQYRSLLNVPPDRLVDAYRSVIASKYSPQALSYRISRGYDDAEVAMCCCVVRMIDALAAGVLYTRYPTREGARSIVQAVRGLGLSAVDGSAAPDSYTIDPKARRVTEFKCGLQHEILRCAYGEGTERRRLDVTGTAAITPEQALEIASLGWRLESIIGVPLDIEWAIDADQSVFVLQVRPLSDVVTTEVDTGRERVSGAVVLVAQGARACAGAAAGVVCHVESDLDLLRCPEGSVVVSREANPRLAVLLPRMAAIVADMGEVTGHLATIARELRVPALFATRNASSILQEGALVTVDADAAVVYEGEVGEAITAAQARAKPQPADPGAERLREAAQLIVPLTLVGRLSSGCSPRKCRTLHDIVRYCHQATIEAMFAIGDGVLREGRHVRRLLSGVPIDCRVIDLGGGLAPRSEREEIGLDEVRCRPLIALWRGMTDERVHWHTRRPVSIRGFMSALVDYNFDQDKSMREMGEPSYAFVTADYLNLNSRIGYHFSTVDARLGPLPESNYASFRFTGGSTGIVQRSRRAELIRRILEAKGFETDCRFDLINARVRHRPAAEMERLVHLVGLLMCYVNHLDMALVSDGVARTYEQEFLAGNYGFKGEEDTQAQPPEVL